MWSLKKPSNLVIFTMETEELTPEVEQEEQNNNEETEEEVKTPEETQEDYRSKLNAQNRFLEKEGYEFKDGKWVKPETKPKEKKAEPKSEGLSIKDTVAIQRANIHEDDIEEVIDFAKHKGVSVSEALKHPVIQSTLKINQSNREAQEALNTKGANPKQTKVSGKDLVEKANQGALPEDDAGIASLADAFVNQSKGSK